MTKSALAWSTGHALDIYSDSSTSLAIHPSNGGANILRVSPAPGSDPVFYAGEYFNSVSQLKYADRLKVTFEVSTDYRKQFVLIKGLLEFHRLPDFSITYDREAGTLEVTTFSSGQAELLSFLGKISGWIKQELSFRQQLKEMISFEREYRQKLAKVYAGGEGFTLGR